MQLIEKKSCSFACSVLSIFYQATPILDSRLHTRKLAMIRSDSLYSDKKGHFYATACIDPTLMFILYIGVTASQKPPYIGL